MDSQCAAGLSVGRAFLRLTIPDTRLDWPKKSEYGSKGLTSKRLALCRKNRGPKRKNEAAGKPAGGLVFCCGGRCTRGFTTRWTGERPAFSGGIGGDGYVGSAEAIGRGIPLHVSGFDRPPVGHHGVLSGKIRDSRPFLPISPYSCRPLVIPRKKAYNNPKCKGRA